jgi:type IV pilus assembly protein PilO
MALLPTRNRDKYMLLVGFAAVAIAAYYFMNVWQPNDELLDEQQLHVDSLVVINQRAKAELAQGKTNALKAEAERYAADLEVMRLLVPTSNEVSALLEQVSTAARRVGLDISDVQPLAQLAGDQYDAYKYRMSVRGAYHQIGDFLANVGSLQRIVAPINLTLAPTAADANSKKNSKTQPLEARFEIETYVARTVVPPAAPKTAKPAAEPSKPGER